MIISLHEAAGLSPSVIGAKAANLAVLAARGFPVPDGLVVSADDDLGGIPGALHGDRFAVRSSAVAEDLADASYAGLYETYLNVPRHEVVEAVRQCRGSAQAARVSAYRDHGDSTMAVLIQPMVDADAAGVAFTANPVTGARDEIVITAVTGLGESLVSGAAVGEEWVVRHRVAERTRADGALNRGQAMAVAELAIRVAGCLDGPQDIEWAIIGDRVVLLQARPMTALPEQVSWQPPGSGLWLRNFRLGEWLPDPVTPLFADWLLPRIDEGFQQGMRDTAGAAVPFAYGLVNGWYYARPNPSLSRLPGALLRSYGRVLPFMINALVRPGRDPAGADRALLSRLYLRWREEVLPAYRELTTRPPSRELVDELGRMAGVSLWYLAVVGGAAWKMEACLTRFMRRYLPGADPQILLRGLAGADTSVPDHAVTSLDWYHPTAAAQPGVHRDDLIQQRIEAERSCRDRLADRPKLLAAFMTMLATTQRYALIREEQARALTLGWPLLRTCVLRWGSSSDVFFLTRRELDSPRAGVAARRRTRWNSQRRLAAPLALGTPPPIIGRHLVGALGLDRRTAGITGQGASPGRATGPVRVVLGPEDFGKVRDGDVLVARTTAPAWTPLFTQVVAVVTDGGTLAAHASLIAREYGIPAVVATADATLRLCDDQIVTVDGTQGIVIS